MTVIRLRTTGRALVCLTVLALLVSACGGGGDDSSADLELIALPIDN